MGLIKKRETMPIKIIASVIFMFLKKQRFRIANFRIGENFMISHRFTLKIFYMRYYLIYEFIMKINYISFRIIY